MANKVDEIWLFPEHGKEPDLSELLAAPDIESATDFAEPFFKKHLRTLECDQERILAEIDAMSEHLASKGVYFPGRSALQISLMERLLITVDNATDWLRGLFGSTSSDKDTAAFLQLSIPIAQTRPTYELSFEYDEIFEETRRFRNVLVAQITGNRGVIVEEVSVPQQVLEDVYESDDWDETQSLLSQIGDMTQIVPPTQNKLGFAIRKKQEDGGNAIEIDLEVLTEERYRRICKALQEVGGALKAV